MSCVGYPPTQAVVDLTYRMSTADSGFFVNIDATTFQHQLAKLAEVVAQKVRREAPKMMFAPGYVSLDIHLLIRQAMRTYDLFFYLNSDERRETDHTFRGVYSIVILPLIRNVIDCLYNITAILRDPATNGAWFRKSGYKRELSDLAEERARHGGLPRWDEWISKKEDALHQSILHDNFAVAEVQGTKTWPTLGSYLRNLTTTHHQFLKTFIHGRWREYSAMAHGAYEGLLDVAFYYADDLLGADKRGEVDDAIERMRSYHLGMVAILLLCIVTEVQAHFGFDDSGARINERIHEVWKALTPIEECQELLKARYKQLMEDRKIWP
jgi:hypothetical protein